MPTYQDELNGVQISEAYAEAMAVAPVTRVMLYTVEVTHPELSEPLRAVFAHDDITATLESTAPYNASEAVLFKALPLGIQLPPESDKSAAPSVRIWIDGVSRYIADQLDYTVETLDAAQLIVRVYASDDLTGPANLPPLTLEVKDIVLDETRVTCTAAYADPANRAFPGKTFTRREYPGLSGR